MVVYFKATVSSKNIRNSEKRIMKQLGMNGEDERLKNGLWLIKTAYCRSKYFLSVELYNNSNNSQWVHHQKHKNLRTKKDGKNDSI